MMAYEENDNQGDIPSERDIAQWEREREKLERASLQHYLARKYLEVYETAFLEITRDDINELVSIIEHSNKEEDVQQFLQSHPSILTHHLGGGHERYCIPKKSLAGMHITDFLLADISSLGINWHAVELENPKAKMFNKNGDPSRPLNHAIRQIRDWKNWLTKNLDEATRLQQEKGLGLIGIEPELDCLILIGRRRDLNETLDTRRRMNKEINGEIHTYDWLIEQARDELERVENRQLGRKIRKELGIELKSRDMKDIEK